MDDEIKVEQIDTSPVDYPVELRGPDDMRQPIVTITCEQLAERFPADANHMRR